MESRAVATVRPPASSLHGPGMTTELGNYRGKPGSCCRSYGAHEELGQTDIYCWTLPRHSSGKAGASLLQEKNLLLVWRLLYPVWRYFLLLLSRLSFFFCSRWLLLSRDWRVSLLQTRCCSTVSSFLGRFSSTATRIASIAGLLHVQQSNIFVP